MAAAASGSARVLRAILDKANIADELMMPIRMHALHEAAKNGHLDVIQVRRPTTIDYRLYTAYCCKLVSFCLHEFP